MIQIDLATLVKRLNPFAKQALEMAASECMSQQASEITVAHVLLQMLAIPRNDVRVIAERTGISAEDLRRADRGELSWWTFRRRLSQLLPDADRMAQGVMAAGLSPDAAQRTAQRRPAAYSAAFTAALYSTRCCRLLTAINRDQLQQDFAAWTKESAESVDLAGGQTPAQRKPATPCLPATPKT